MPARARGSTYKTKNGFGIRWYDRYGGRQYKSGFRSRTEARDWWEQTIAPSSKDAARRSSR